MKHLLFSLFLVLISRQVLFSQAGTLDPTFGVGGLVSYGPHAKPSSTAWGAEVAEDGKILIGGNSHRPYIVRYRPDGKRDTSFADNGMLIYPKFWPTVMKALPGGKILLIGTQIARLNADGSDDPSCDGTLPNGAQPASDCVLQQDGKFLVALSGSTAPLNHYCVARYLENGSLDPSFGQNGLAHNDSEWSGQANDMTVQPDGKILVTGYNGKEKLSMARYLANGAPDLGFGDNGMLVWGDTMPTPPEWYLAWGGDTIGEYPFVAKTLVQPDGKILVATQVPAFDSLFYYGWVKRTDLFRLNPDGSTDSTFGANGVVTLTDLRVVFDIFFQSDGKIQIAGGTDYNEALLQILPNGIIDPNFQETTFTDNKYDSYDQGFLDFAQQADGKIIAALSIRWTQPMAIFPFNLYATRLLVDGSTDESFAGNNANAGWVSDAPLFGNDYTKGVAIQTDGKILVFGISYNYMFSYNHYDWFPSPFVSRLNPDGTKDPTWWITGTSVFSNYNPALTSIGFYGIAVVPDGKTILAYGYFGLKIARFKNTATIDSTFGGDGIVDLPSNLTYAGIAVQPDGKSLVAATMLSGATVVFRLLANGDMDTSFGLAGTADLGQIGACIGLTLLPNGKIVLAGSGGKVAQLTANGQFDSAFSNDGLAEFPLTIRSIAVQSDGKIVLGVGTDEIGIARIAADGSGLDATFAGGNGVLSFPAGGNPALCKSIALQPDGKIVATGTRAGDLILLRSTAAGQVDSTFGSMGQTVTNFGYGYNVPANVAIQPNGKIVVGALIQQLTGTRISILRYLSGLTVGTDNAVLPQTALMALPNPFSNSLHLDFSALPALVSRVDVLDMSGRQVFQANDFAAQRMHIPESKDWTPGVYLVRAKTESGVFVQKIVKQ